MMSLNDYPIGTVLLLPRGTGIFRVTAHLESNKGSRKPWQALAAELIVGDVYPVTEERYEKLAQTVIAGELPPREKLGLVMLNSYGRNIVHLEDIRVVSSQHRYYFHAPNFYMLVLEDPGDPSVGLPGYVEVVSSLGFLLEDAEHDSYGWLAGVASWLYENLEKYTPYSIDLLLSDDEHSYRARVELPRSVQVRDVLDREYVLEANTLENYNKVRETYDVD